MDETEIDLSQLSVTEACYWLLASLNADQFEDYAYAIPFSNYVMTWPKAVPIDSILILQSPYPNDIFPEIAAAMSYSTELCKQKMKGRTMPPTIQVLANDLYINVGMEKEDTITILKNGWALIDKGILLVNEAVFHQYEPSDAYIESIKQCSVLIRLLQETEKYGKRTVNIYAFGESGERVGSNLCSWYKSPIVKLSKRKVTHPAGIARRFDNLDHPDCHMATSSFSKALAKCFSNHVAFMYNMGKKVEESPGAQRLKNTLISIKNHFPNLEEAITNFVKLQVEFAEMNKDEPEYKDTLDKITKAGDAFANRLRIANSMIGNLQSYESSVAGNVSRNAPSMKTNKPSESLLSEHVGQASNTIGQAIDEAPVTFKTKRSITTPAKTSSFTQVSSPPSVTSVQSEAPTPAPEFKLKTKRLPTKRSINQTPTKPVSEPKAETVISKEDKEEDDIISPLTRKFTKKVVVPNSRSNTQPIKQETKAVEGVPNISPMHKKVLSSIQGIVEVHKPGAIDNDECIENFEKISEDLKHMKAYNFITQHLISAIDKDKEEISDFDINKWLSSTTTDTCATFEVCKTEFEF